MESRTCGHKKTKQRLQESVSVGFEDWCYAVSPPCRYIISSESIIIIKVNEVSQVFPCLSACSYEDAWRLSDNEFGGF